MQTEWLIGPLKGWSEIRLEVSINLCDWKLSWIVAWPHLLADPHEKACQEFVLYSINHCVIHYTWVGILVNPLSLECRVILHIASYAHEFLCCSKSLTNSGIQKCWSVFSDSCQIHPSPCQVTIKPRDTQYVLGLVKGQLKDYGGVYLFRQPLVLINKNVLIQPCH